MNSVKVEQLMLFANTMLGNITENVLYLNTSENFSKLQESSSGDLSNYHDNEEYIFISSVDNSLCSSTVEDVWQVCKDKITSKAWEE